MCCSRVACRITLKANKMAQCSLQPQQPLAVDTFKICKSISRIGKGMDVSPKEVIHCDSVLDVLVKKAVSKWTHVCTNAHAQLWHSRDQGCW